HGLAEGLSPGACIGPWIRPFAPILRGGNRNPAGRDRSRWEKSRRSLAHHPYGVLSLGFRHNHTIAVVTICAPISGRRTPRGKNETPPDATCPLFRNH